MKYTSINNEKIKNLRKLNQKKYRDETNLFLVEGEHLVIEAFRSGLLVEVIIEDGELMPIPCEISYATKEVIKSLSSLQNASNIIGICKKKESSKELGNKIIFLDNVQDPGNLGTIIRSAVAFNVDSIIINGGVDVYNEKVVRATQGMLFHINIIDVKDYQLLEELKEKDYKIIGTKVSGGKSTKNIEKTEKFVIILGNEGNGMSDEAEELTNLNVYIPMNDLCESLNVAVAASIILYELDK